MFPTGQLPTSNLPLPPQGGYTQQYPPAPQAGFAPAPVVGEPQPQQQVTLKVDFADNIGIVITNLEERTETKGVRAWNKAKAIHVASIKHLVAFGAKHATRKGGLTGGNTAQNMPVSAINDRIARSRTEGGFVAIRQIEPRLLARMFETVRDALLTRGGPRLLEDTLRGRGYNPAALDEFIGWVRKQDPVAYNVKVRMAGEVNYKIRSNLSLYNFDLHYLYGNDKAISNAVIDLIINGIPTGETADFVEADRTTNVSVVEGPTYFYGPQSATTAANVVRFMSIVNPKLYSQFAEEAKEMAYASQVLPTSSTTLSRFIELPKILGRSVKIPSQINPGAEDKVLLYQIYDQSGHPSFPTKEGKHLPSRETTVDKFIALLRKTDLTEIGREPNGAPIFTDRERVDITGFSKNGSIKSNHSKGTKETARSTRVYLQPFTFRVGNNSFNVSANKVFAKAMSGKAEKRQPNDFADITRFLQTLGFQANDMQYNRIVAAADADWRAVTRRAQESRARTGPVKYITEGRDAFPTY